MQATHRNGTVLSFYSMPEYESWKESLAENASGWSIKYYKVCSFDMEDKNLGIHGYIYVLLSISVNLSLLFPSWGNIAD